MRKRKLYLSELLNRLATNNEIYLMYPPLKITWFYTSKIQALNDLKPRPFWNCQVQEYAINKNVVCITLDKFDVD